MIKQEYFMIRKDGVKLYRTYSDNNKIIKQLETGLEYAEAIDVYPVRYTYIETDKLIENEVTNNDTN